MQNQVISTFEILVKRIAPLGPVFPNNVLIPDQDEGFNSVFRRVIQGHFLTITNLELNRPLYFSVSYIMASNPTLNALREFTLDATGIRNFDLAYDGNLGDNINANTGAQLLTTTVPPFPFRLYKTLKSTNLLLGPGETGILALFPNIIPGPLQAPALNGILTAVSPGFELRGHIRIRQEATANNETNPYINLPADILLSSELRGTFLDNDFNGVNFERTVSGGIVGAPRIGFDFDQLAYSLPLGNGASLYTLDGV